ncbi:MAG: serine/threonine protein kinase, partial [Candidatus Marinamargulisbacteria bacterium]
QRTPGYAAPEVMIYEEVPNGSNDMWALGVLYFEGLTGIRFDSAMKDSGGDIVACVPKEDVTSRAILSHLIVNDPMGRWTITQLSDYLHASLG